MFCFCCCGCCCIRSCNISSHQYILFLISGSVIAQSLIKSISQFSASVDAASATALSEPSQQSRLSVERGGADAPQPEAQEDAKVSFLDELVEGMRTVCCIPEEMSSRLVTKNELRETVKQRADIYESPVRESALNMHALLLMLVTAVLWGFLA